jgi:hypothetical protein
MLITGMLTAPREVVYAGQTMTSYLDEFPDVVTHLFEEPNSPKFYGRSRCITHLTSKEKRGIVENWWHTASYLFSSTSEPFIMTMEDDIEWTTGSGEKTMKLLNSLYEGFHGLPPSKIGFISPYCSKMNAPSDKGWREAKYGRPGWCGALSLIFPQHALKRILSDKDRFLRYTIDERFPERGFVHLDYAIGRVLKEEGLMLLTHSPTLVLHLGERSTDPKNNKEHVSREPHRW